MKIEIIRKSDPNDVGVIDLSKVTAVHNHPIEGLEIFSELNGIPAKFSDELFDFCIIEFAEDGKPHMTAVPVSKILTAYMSEE